MFNHDPTQGRTYIQVERKKEKLKKNLSHHFLHCYTQRR